MQTIGLIGGMSWESTTEYYRIINEHIADALGGYHSAKIVLVSVDFHEIETMQSAGDWNAAGRAIGEAAAACERAGADFLLLCTNTMHKVVERAAPSVSIPFLHIADATGEAIRAAGRRRVGLLGTRFTMEEPFYRERLETLHGLDVLVPNAAGRETVHRVIYDELVHGVINERSRQEYRRVIAALVREGAEAIVAGCTEIGLLVTADDTPVPLFDTARIHATAAAERALAAPAQ